MDPAIVKLIVLVIAGCTCGYFGFLCLNGDARFASQAGMLTDDGKGYDRKKTSVAGGYALLSVGVMTILLGVFITFFPEKLTLAATVYGGFVALTILILIVLVQTVFKK